MNDLSRLHRPRSDADSASAQRQALRLLEAGRVQDAEALLAPSIAVHVDDGRLFHLYGVILSRLAGRLRDAVIALERANTLIGADAGVLADLGQAYLRLKRHARAEETLKAALALRPDMPAAWFALGRLHQDASAWADAETCLARAVALAPRALDALVLLGSVRDQLGRYEDALAAYRSALAIAPRHAPALGAMGKTYEAYGRRDDALAAYRAALSMEPQNLQWRRALLRIEAQTVPATELESAYHAASEPELRMHLGFALGKRAEKAGDFERAARWLADANRLARASVGHDRDATRKSFADIEAHFTPDRFERLAGSCSPDPTPIFILGMPRSGTTLLEQILASHEDVHGGGELPYLRQVVGAEAERIGASGYADLLARLAPADLRRMGETYVARLRQLSQKRHIVDKLPGNFLLIGMIRLMLPHATILHVTRDPADNALSIWKNFFGDQLSYAYDMAELGEYHRLYRQLMRHWHRVLPGWLHDVSYETLVAQQEAETRRVLALGGLAFDPACLRFYETARPVHTVSIEQVRAPVTDSSIGLARRYGDSLQPLIDALGTS
jgi:tetratricopeptide (TPR) repeat protein